MLNPPPASGDSPIEPMQLGNVQLSLQEHSRRQEMGLCLYCGQAKHCIAQCQARQQRCGTDPNAKPLGVSSFIVQPVPLCVLNAIIVYSDVLSVLPVLIDSGSAGDFMDHETAVNLRIKLVKLRTPKKLHTIDRGPNGTGFVTHPTPPVLMKAHSLHQECISFLITDTKKYPLILGQPWLKRYNPAISWDTPEITHWSNWCHQHCLDTAALLIASTSIESPKTSGQVPLPTEYSAKQRPVVYHHTVHMIVP